MDGGFIGLFFGYPPDSVFKQSIYTGFEEINKKVDNAEQITEFCRASLEKLGYFVNAKSNLKWVINQSYSENQIEEFLGIIEKIIFKIKENGLSSR